MPMILRVLLTLLAVGALCYAALVGYVVVRESGVSKDPAEVGNYDAIIVLGAQVKADGTPNVQLSWRLDAAAEAWNHHAAPIVVCGAQGADEPLPEAEAMRVYLMDKGIPEDQIRMDPNSFNTRENLLNARELLGGEESIRTVLIVSSDYHVPRAMALAQDLGYEAVGLGAPCKADYWIKNHFREALAWGKYWMVKYLHVNL